MLLYAGFKPVFVYIVIINQHLGTISLILYEPAIQIL